ncbi:MAG TPA: hypothetical protein VNK95_01535 [Caldilineaceae bacterium]|nr:hypothetical protein [Caldilineaceae bacterium]
MPTTLLLPCLTIAGLFTAALGTLHFFFPVLWDFAQAIPREGAALRPMRLGPLRYGIQRSDVYGIAWVMNHAASYTLVTIGALDLLAARWLGTSLGGVLALWIAGFWFIRAASQLYLGRRLGDWLILAGFALLGLLHLWAATI